MPYAWFFRELQNQDIKTTKLGYSDYGQDCGQDLCLDQQGES